MSTKDGQFSIGQHCYVSSTPENSIVFFWNFKINRCNHRL